VLEQKQRGPVSAAGVLVPLVLAADALAALALALMLSVPLLFYSLDEQGPPIAFLLLVMSPDWTAPASGALFLANVVALFLLTGRLRPAASAFPAPYDRRMAVFAQISLGVHDCERAAAFWARALGYVRRAPRWAGDDWIVIEPPPGVSGAAIAMDLSETKPPEFPRIHLDLRAPDGDLDGEVARLVALGATHVDWPFYPEPGERHPAETPFVVLADPEGNRFCVAA
jgi:hypothetical protein